MGSIHSGSFHTSDGVTLRYSEAGQGEPLLMLPGGGFSADIFQAQIEAFSPHYRVIALNQRGHGRSEKVDFGYRVARLAKDLHDGLVALKLDKVNLLCHSLGAAVAYQYVDLFGSDRINKLIVIDEPPVLLIDPDWSEAEQQRYGAVYKADELYALVNGFTGDQVDTLKDNIVDKMTTSRITPAQKQFIRGCMDLPGEAAARLYFNNICQDYRDVLAKLDIPVLFITGKDSIHPWQSHQWMHEQVAGSMLEVFTEAEGGNHFMFVENPQKFNQVVMDFLMG